MLVMDRRWKDVLGYWDTGLAVIHGLSWNGIFGCSSRGCGQENYIYIRVRRKQMNLCLHPHGAEVQSPSYTLSLEGGPVGLGTRSRFSWCR